MMETCKALYKAPSCAITCCPVRLFLHSAIHLKFSIIPLASSDNSTTRTLNLEGATADINCNDVVASKFRHRRTSLIPTEVQYIIISHVCYISCSSQTENPTFLTCDIPCIFTVCSYFTNTCTIFSLLFTFTGLHVSTP